MIINLQLQVIGQQNVLPINYQYEFSSWIYKTFHFGNKEFAEFLHSRGYFNEKRQFKLFAFSNLQFEGRNAYKVQKDRLILNSGVCTMQLSTILPNALKYFIDGLFAQQEFEIGDKKSRVKFRVNQVTIDPIQAFEQTVILKALSPICVAKSEIYQGKRQAQYKSPEDEGYWQLLKSNLENKWQIVKELDLIEEDTQTIDWQFKLLSKNIKSRLVHIKANTDAHTKVKGFLFDFELTAPKHYLQTASLCGVGEENSQGFGCVGVIKNQ